MAKQRICPSVTGEAADARIIGHVGAGGVVAAIPTPIPLTPAMRASLGPRPERMFRLAGTCSEERCANWQNASCGLIGRMRDLRDPGGNTDADAAPATLARCGIRQDCRWWLQDGPAACRVCPRVVYNPSM